MLSLGKLKVDFGPRRHFEVLAKVSWVLASHWSSFAPLYVSDFTDDGVASPPPPNGKAVEQTSRTNGRSVGPLDKWTVEWTEGEQRFMWARAAESIETK